MRSTFRPNRIFERQSSQNRHTGLKFSPNRENSALFLKIVQNGLFRSCAARFGQIALLGGKVLNIVTLAYNSLQNGKTVRFKWKSCQNVIFSGHAQHVLAKSHFYRQISQNRYACLKFSLKGENSALSMEIVQDALFRSCAERFGQIAFLSGKFLKMITLVWNLAKTGKQCAFHENCTKRYFQVIRSTF